jgi:hypothetical protein
VTYPNVNLSNPWVDLTLLDAVDMYSWITTNLNALVPLLSDTGWTSTGTMSNSWVNTGAPWQTAQYRLKSGIVYIEGTIKSGSAAATIFTLPVGMRPLNQLQFTCPSGTGNATGQITSGGALSITTYTTGGSNAGVSLLIAFVADQ